MTEYEVYHHPIKGYAAVKRGFSWPGFFFGIFWALVKKLWKFAGLLVLVIFVSRIFCQLLIRVGHNIDNFLLSNLVIAFGALGDLSVPVIIWIIIGFKGNKWAKSDLINRGYSLLRRVESTSPDASIATVVKGNVHSKPSKEDRTECPGL
jgi:Protein of unknown function (DUF2628)